MRRKKSSKRDWARAAPKPTVEHFASLWEGTHRVSANFLKLDLHTALNFISIARAAENEVNRVRNRKAAHRAYETVVRLTEKVDLTDAETRDVNRDLKRLRSELAELGEVV